MQEGSLFSTSSAAFIVCRVLKQLFIYLALAVLSLHCCTGFSRVVASGCYSLVAVHRLLTVVASLCCGAWALVVACGLQRAGSVVAVHGLSCSMACGIFLGQGLNWCPLHCKADS